MIYTFSPELNSSVSLPISLYLYNFVINYNDYFSINNEFILQIVNYIYTILDIELINISFIYSIELPQYIYILQKTTYIYNYYIYNNAYIYIFILLICGSNILFFFLPRIEKELNTIDDLFIFNILLALVLFFIIGFYTYFFYITWLFLYFFYFTSLLFILIILMLPISLLFQYGFFISYYLRGTTTTLSLFYEIILDFINLISFFLRILIQFIRIFLILLTVISLDELFIEFNMSFYNIFIDYNNTTWLTAFLLILQYLFEWFHFSIIFFVQLGTFVLMLLWLFQFLFSMFGKQYMETFFLYLRTL